MDIRFDGKRALVTGAGKGLGRGIAVKLGECGAKVVAVARTAADLESLQKEAPGTETHICDLTDWDKTRALMESLGPIDLLVNNAGNCIISSMMEVKKDDLDYIFDLNFKSHFNVTQVIAKGMIERGNGGAIVNMASMLGIKPTKNWGVYACTKTALDAFTRCLALELGPHKIRVNSVNPTIVKTDLVDRCWTKDELTNMINKTPLGQLPDIKDVVDTTLFLLSDKAMFTHGTVNIIDGGATAIL